MECEIRDCNLFYVSVTLSLHCHSILFRCLISRVKACLGQGEGERETERGHSWLSVHSNYINQDSVSVLVVSVS